MYLLVNCMYIVHLHIKQMQRIYNNMLFSSLHYQFAHKTNIIKVFKLVKFLFIIFTYLRYNYINNCLTI